MQEVFEKIIEKIKSDSSVKLYGSKNSGNYMISVDKAIEIVKQEAEEFAHDTNVGSNGWIPVSECLPKDLDNRFYMCIVENHEEDLPMFCQYDEEYGFGFWHDIFNEETLGFVDTEFKTNEELGYEKVIAWMPLPEPYRT